MNARIIVLWLTLFSCAAPDPQIWTCKATLVCNAATQTGTYDACYLDDQVKNAEHEWLLFCNNVTGVYGCSPWACGETCHPTGSACAPVDGGAK